MAWKIACASFAEQQIAAIYAYYLNEAKAQVTKKIAAGIIKSCDPLIKTPE